jgi:hypothetical protein
VNLVMKVWLLQSAGHFGIFLEDVFVYKNDSVSWNYL